MLSEALEFPRRGEGWLKRIGIGGVLYLVGAFLFLPLLPVYGYLYQTLARSTRGETDPPEFVEWVELFVDGIKLLVVHIAYSLVPVILFGIGALFIGMGAFGGGGLRAIGGIFIALGGLSGLLVMYILPAALSNFAYEDRLGAAFHLRTVLGAAFTWPYFTAIVLAIVIGFVLGFIGLLLSVVLVGIFILFYVQVVVFYLWGQGFARGLGLEATE